MFRSGISEEKEGEQGNIAFEWSVLAPIIHGTCS